MIKRTLRSAPAIEILPLGSAELPLSVNENNNPQEFVKIGPISISLINIDDDGPGITKSMRPQNCTLSEHRVDGQCIHKRDQSIWSDGQTVRLMTPIIRPIQSRTVTYALTVPADHHVNDNYEIHGPDGYLRTISTRLLDDDMQPIDLDAISLSIVEQDRGLDGSRIYWITKASTIDLHDTGAAWFDIEVAMHSWVAIYVSYYEPWLASVDRTTGKGTLAEGRPRIYAGRYYQSSSSKYVNTINRPAIKFNTAAMDSNIWGMFLIGAMYDGTLNTGFAVYSYNTDSMDVDGYSAFGARLGEAMGPATGPVNGYPFRVFMRKTAFKNRPNGYTNFMLRELTYDANALSSDSIDKNLTLLGATNDPNKTRLLVLYNVTHQGPTKRIYLNPLSIPSTGNYQFTIRINRNTADGVAILDGLYDKTSATDLNVRNASGNALYASRTLTKSGSVITSIDLRIEASATDMQGELMLAYGSSADPDYSIPTASITGSTIPQAESNPLPGVFWDYKEFILDVKLRIFVKDQSGYALEQANVSISYDAVTDQAETDANGMVEFTVTKNKIINYTISKAGYTTTAGGVLADEDPEVLNLVIADPVVPEAPMPEKIMIAKAVYEVTSIDYLTGETVARFVRYES